MTPRLGWQHYIIDGEHWWQAKWAVMDAAEDDSGEWKWLIGRFVDREMYEAFVL